MCTKLPQFIWLINFREPHKWCYRPSVLPSAQHSPSGGHLPTDWRSEWAPSSGIITKHTLCSDRINDVIFRAAPAATIDSSYTSGTSTIETYYSKFIAMQLYVQMCL